MILWRLTIETASCDDFPACRDVYHYGTRKEALEGYETVLARRERDASLKRRRAATGHTIISRPCPFAALVVLRVERINVAARGKAEIIAMLDGIGYVRDQRLVREWRP